MATGLCSGAAIINGFECATGLNDYVVTIEVDPLFEDGTFTSCGDPAQNPLLGPCNEANPVAAGEPNYQAVCDLDGDALADLVVPNAGDATVSILINGGGGTYRPQVLRSTGDGLGFDPPLAFSVDANPNTVVSTDLNGDLVPDLITMNQDPDQETGGVGITDFLDLLAHWGPCP